MINIEGRKMIKDFNVVLKDFEPMVKDPKKWLLNGRDITNFSLRPREAWANWLLCVVLRKLYGDQITFMEDKDGDGILIDKKNRKFIITEHVSALENPLADPMPKGEDRVIDAINKKISRGPNYAKNKTLVVFFDGAGKYYRNKIREAVRGKHNFINVYIIGLLTSDEMGYAYAVTELHDDFSITFKVDIDFNFTKWDITQI